MKKHTKFKEGMASCMALIVKHGQFTGILKGPAFLWDMLLIIPLSEMPKSKIYSSLERIMIDQQESLHREAIYEVEVRRAFWKFCAFSEKTFSKF